MPLLQPPPLPLPPPPPPPPRRWHLFDAVVVAGSLGLELTLRGVAQEVASLLIFFRCGALGRGGVRLVWGGEV